ncbi:MAG: type II toxin-antitoxin system VapC family toxin [Candidatus Nanohalobium sp.]
MVFVDSNIWCYYFDSSAPEHEDVAEKLDELLESDEEIRVNTVVLTEVSHFLVKNLGGVKGREKLDTMVEYPFKVTDLTYSLMDDSLDILSREHQTGIGGRDATIISAMKHEDEEKLVTHDQAFKKIQEIEVIDPVS